MFTNKFGKPHCLRVQEFIYYLLEKETTSVDFKNLNVNGRRHVRERKNKNTDCEERFSNPAAGFSDWRRQRIG